MTVYCFVKNCVDEGPEIKVFDTIEKAKRAIEAEIGGYIAECIREKDYTEAINYVSNLKVGDTDKWYFYDKYYEFYIEEKEIE